MAERNLPHLVVVQPPIDQPYRRPGVVVSTPVRPPADRIAHASRLEAELRAVEREGQARGAIPGAIVVGAIEGMYIVFDSFPGIALALPSLDPQQGKRHPELRSVRRVSVGGAVVERATVFVPDGTLTRFLKQVEQYLATAGEDKPLRRNLLDRIESITLASLEAFWTEQDTPFPDPHAHQWWEVWLRRREGEVRRLTDYAGQTGMRVNPQVLQFPDHAVILVQGTAAQLAGAVDVLDDLAELRLPREPASMIARESARDQADWVEQLLARTRWPAADSPAVCVVDTGVDRGHPLLGGALADLDCHTCNPAWGSRDNHGHGTEMAGLALYGDLGATLIGSQVVDLRHRLESVKLLPGPGAANAPELYGAVTAAAASLVEIAAPDRRRTFAIATTSSWVQEPAQARPAEGYGRPSSWSSAVDALAAGLGIDATQDGVVFLEEEGPRQRRLFVLAAGNVRPPYDEDHLARSDVSPVEDPGQAWNALTVGAFTELTSLHPPQAGFEEYSPVARTGDLSPFSRTSVVYETRTVRTATRWPIKPDVVFEGGNLARSPEGLAFDTPDALHLLTTARMKSGRPFTLTNGTSPATAQAAHMAASIMAQYPGLWPETVRALIVHAAEWTPAMRQQFEAVTARQARVALQRRYGMGVPDLARALHSASDALTLLVQESIQPFDGQGRMGRFHLHELPWPTDELRGLGGTPVRLRVTLSYFVEPNPSSRGWRDRYSYPSHQLRFALRGAAEAADDFEKRINQMARSEDDKDRSFRASDGHEWIFGAEARTVGSLHTDIWTGTAADLAERGAVAIYPVTGWWRGQTKRDRSAAGAPYALVISIETPSQDVDIWSPVAQQIGVPIEIER